MPTLTPDQQNYYYLQEAETAGIHKAIWPALDRACSSPYLPDGETGLGISPANRIQDLKIDFTKVPQPNLAYLERSLLAILTGISEYYAGLPHQRDAIVRIAKLARRTRDRICCPFLINSCYLPQNMNRTVGAARYSCYIVGDALDFTCGSLSGKQRGFLTIGGLVAWVALANLLTSATLMREATKRGGDIKIFRNYKVKV